MPGIARKNGVDRVNTVHNVLGDDCNDAPIIIGTDEGSDNVFVNNVGAVRIGDAVEPHQFPGCSVHAPPLITGSRTVFVNNRGVGRVGDTYAGTEQIITGSTNVFADG